MPSATWATHWILASISGCGSSYVSGLNLPINSNLC